MQQRRPRFEQGGPDNSFMNQRGVLGAPPTGLGGLGGPGNVGGPQGGIGGQPGPLGPNSLPGSALRGGPPGLGVAGAGPGPNMFHQSSGNLTERLLMERRREAAREELNDMKRMRRF